ncbi:hypothetical protein C804_04112 [Lachnospiraceae bacterium A4]|nr:hypothetical protein C804_04112 [Lachnospiraceae bacterium A4]
MNYKIIVWGIGAIYNKHLNILKYYELKNEIEIVGITATDIPKVRAIDGYQVISLNELTFLKYDYLLIMNDLHYFDIRERAIIIGVDERKILHYKFLELPNLVFADYIKLKKDRISIISNNCWGGTIYSTLGLECLSPFKNLFLKDDSYLRLLNNLDYYLNCEPVFMNWAVDPHSRNSYPVLRLDDVYVHCNHDMIPETAIRNWNRRRKKINMNNLFIEMYTDNIETAKCFKQLNNFENKICFVPFASNEKSLYYLKLFHGQSELWEAVISSARNGKNSISYNIVDLLNGKVVHRLKK